MWRSSNGLREAGAVHGRHRILLLWKGVPETSGWGAHLFSGASEADEARVELLYVLAHLRATPTSETLNGDSNHCCSV